MPGSRLRIVLSDYPRRQSGNDRIGRDTSSYHRIDCYDAVTAYRQLPFWANDGCAMADPTPSANPDPATFINALFDNWHHDVFVYVIVVHNDDRLADKYVALQMDLIPGGYDAAVSYMTVILNYNYGIPLRIINGNVEPRVLSQADEVSQADSRCEFSVQMACKVNRDIMPQ